jgi:hypothetical protein
LLSHPCSLKEADTPGEKQKLARRNEKQVIVTLLMKEKEKLKNVAS